MLSTGCWKNLVIASEYFSQLMLKRDVTHVLTSPPAHKLFRKCYYIALYLSYQLSFLNGIDDRIFNKGEGHLQSFCEQTLSYVLI